LDRLSDELADESMTIHDEYLDRIYRLLDSLSTTLSAEERAEIEHFIDHGEPAEGLRTLAWIIVDADKYVPSDAIASIRELSEGLISPEHMPPTLDAHALPRE
jgi:hypothetical protein